MAIETTATASTAANAANVAGLSVITVVAIVGNIDVSILLGAFAGSVVFVMSAREYHWLMRLVYLFTGTTISYLSAQWTASIFALSSVVVAAIVNGVLCIVVLNGLIEQGRSGKVLQAIIKILSALKK